MAELSETTARPGETAASPAKQALPERTESESKNNTGSSANSPLPKMRWQCLAPKRALGKSDVMIRRLDRLISTTSGQERLLALIQYNSEILYYLLRSPPLRSIITRLRSILLRSSSPSSPSSPPPPRPPQPKQPRLLALSSLISETRTTIRLLGLLSLWSWGSETLAAPPADPVLRTIAYAQIGANVVYQLLENVAHLAAKGVVSRRVVERWGSVGRWYAWSTRAWLGHVLLEFVRVWREYVLAGREGRGKMGMGMGMGTGTGMGDREGDGDGDGDGGSELDLELERQRERQRERERRWKKSLVNSLAWLPLCVHWSFEDGVGVPDRMVGALGMAASVWGVYDMWNATAGMV
ncbi:peroxin 11C [Histoplasma capsulatum H143]|uniref:Peroxin 11C n=1 Tax=Ajellomyces capsulatus (strain H143) TaxID=544712 RepID=C6HP21_AJECH|nr:peroxin 11C [Histoplasma capsulatum H143]